MSFDLTKLIHSVPLKDFAKTVLAAAKQLSDEGALVVASTSPTAAAAVAIVEPLTDAAFDAIIERVSHLQSNQEAKAAAVSAVAQ
jgi:hypothetical protein